MRVGIDSLRRQDFGPLRGKRVGLLSHQAALTAGGATSAQLLRHTPGLRLVALYGPEHGFFGQASAGEHIHTRQHPDWKIPVYSLYGDRRKPPPEMLDGVDIVVCDLQDLGTRCYTYLATLLNMLVACMEAGVEVLVADRPIPLPHIVDGPMPDLQHASFVAPCVLPMVYGMTPAEAALWMRNNLRQSEAGEQPPLLLSSRLKLSVAPMEGWSRADAAWDGGRPDWLPPSPGIKTWEAAMTYAATVFTEALPGIDCGRGTNLSFRVFGAPWLNAEECCPLLAQHGLAGVAFHPYRYTAGTAPYAGKELDGIRLSVTDPARFRPVRTSAAILRTLAGRYGDARVWRHEGARPEWFDKLYGSGLARGALESGTPLEQLFASWDEGSENFLRERKSVLLYA